MSRARFLPALDALSNDRNLSVEDFSKLVRPAAKDVLQKIREAYNANQEERIKQLIQEVNALNYTPPTTARWLLGLYDIYKDGEFVYVEPEAPDWSIPGVGYKYASSSWSEATIEQAMYFLLALTLYNMFYEYDEAYEDVLALNTALEQTFDPMWRELTTPRIIRGSAELSEFVIMQMKAALRTFRLLDDDDTINRIESSAFVRTYIAAGRYVKFRLIDKNEEKAQQVYRDWLDKPKVVEFDWKSLLSQQFVRYDQLPATFQGLRIRYTYLPLKEYSIDEFIVPLNKFGNVEQEFRVSWGRSVLGEELKTPDQLQAEAYEIVRNHKAAFPYDKVPMLHLDDIETWNVVKERMLTLIKKDWNPKDNIYERPQSEAEGMFDRLERFLERLKFYIRFGVPEKQDVYYYDRGLSKAQWSALLLFLLATGLKSASSKEILNTKWRGREGALALQYPEQKYMAQVLYALTSLLDDLVKSDNIELWRASAKEKRDLLSDRDDLIKQYAKDAEDEAKGDNVLTRFGDWLGGGGLPRWFNKPTEIESQRLVVQSLSAKLSRPEAIVRKLASEGQLDSFILKKRINTVVMNGLALAIDATQNMNAYQRKSFDRAFELSGAADITKWELYDLEDPPKYLKGDILYIPKREQMIDALVAAEPALVKDLATGWLLLFEIISNLFEPIERFDRQLVEEKLEELETLDLKFGTKARFIKGSYNVTLLDVPTRVGAPISEVSNNHVDWDYVVSPTIVEPILKRVLALNIEQRAKLTQYITMDQMVDMGMIRPDIGFVTGITHSTHPALTTKYIVGYQDPLTGYYSFRWPLEDELRLLKKWRIADKLLQQLENDEPADEVLQKELNQGR